MLKIVSGVVLALAGTVWILQGLNIAFAPQSFMTGEPYWSWIGSVAVLAGFGLIWWGVGSRNSAE